MSQQAYETSRLLRQNMERVVLGKPDVIRLIVVSLLAAEHVLLEDVPGVGKTLAAKALAQSIDGRFNRLQFTPDLLPSDITARRSIAQTPRIFISPKVLSLPTSSWPMKSIVRRRGLRRHCWRR